MVDCSTVSDNDLFGYIDRRWKNPLDIVYGFSAKRPYYLRNVGTSFSPPLIPTTIASDGFKQAMRQYLEQWQQASNGLLRFRELDTPYTSELDIHFATCGTKEAFYNNTISGFTESVSGLLNHDHLLLSTVCLPENVFEHPSSYNDNTALHEIGHALGFDHLHLGTAGEKLKQIKHGTHCSVMPYTYELLNAKTQCLPPTCSNRFPSKLGPLDKRLVQLAYGGQHESEIQAARIKRSTEILQTQLNTEEYINLAFITYVMLVRPILRKAIKKIATPEIKNSKHAECFADLTTDIATGLALVGIGLVTRPGTALVLFGFMGLRIIGNFERIIGGPKIQCLGQLSQSDVFWYVLLGYLVGQNHAVKDGPSPFIEGSYAMAAGLFGSAAGTAIASHYLADKKPLLPLTNPQQYKKR